MKTKKAPFGQKNPAVKNSVGDASAKELLRMLAQKNIRYLDLIPRESFEEKIVHLVLEGQGPWKEAGPVFDEILSAKKRYPTGGVRTVVFGGGTGLSSILGGDTALDNWAQSPFVGLKRFFPHLTVSVCVTDDGGSSGELLRYFRCIALGDLRRAILSSITPRHLLARYPTLQLEQLETAAAAFQQILNYRFGRDPHSTFLKTPSLLLSKSMKNSLPDALLRTLDKLGSSFLTAPHLNKVPLEGQCLGNLLLLASVYEQWRKKGRGRTRGTDPGLFTPSHKDMLKGIQGFAEGIGAGHDRIFPAHTTQGELQVLYRHGVLSAGEAKSAERHSSFPVHRVWVHWVAKPNVDPELIERIEHAELILLAPGSLYTSLIPIFQIPAVTEAIRRNRRALKILGVNFWAQRGETDISLRRRGKEYYVSDLIEAFHQNIPGGVEGLFQTCIVTDLQSIPGDILRNYALEGKVPIYLDKERVRKMGFDPVEAAVFSEQKLRNEKVIQHDPEKFAHVVKTLCFLRHSMGIPKQTPLLTPSSFDPSAQFPRRGYLCEYWTGINRKIDELDCTHNRLRHALREIVWNNREILEEHLSYIKGVQMIRKKQWKRSTEWDNILGYYEPEDGYLKIHESLLKGPEDRLTEDLLIALGESLLGNYCKSKAVHEVLEGGDLMGKVFQIELRPPKQRKSFLGDKQIREYLCLAQLRPLPEDSNRFSMLINDNEAFTPPGLLFGLLYAWYVNNRFGGIVDYEISLLQWKISELIPKPSMERTRMKKRIEFFRRSVFRQNIPLTFEHADSVTSS